MVRQVDRKGGKQEGRKEGQKIRWYLGGQVLRWVGIKEQL